MANWGGTSRDIRFEKEALGSKQANIDKLIEQINKLYMIHRMKNPKDTVNVVCKSLVQEINKRYGLLKKEEVLGNFILNLLMMKLNNIWEPWLNNED